MLAPMPQFLFAGFIFGGFSIAAPQLAVSEAIVLSELSS